MRCQDRRLVARQLQIIAAAALPAPQAPRLAACRMVALFFAASLLACGGSGPKIVAGPMPEGGSFTGVYFSPQYGEMNMIQNGSAVIGEYKHDEREGKIQGEASGDLMKFVWTEHKAMVRNRAQESRGHGYFRYMVDKANGEHVIKGEWGLNDAETGGGPWNAVKAKRKIPKLSSGSGESSSGGESEESESSSSGNEEESSDDLF